MSDLLCEFVHLGLCLLQYLSLSLWSFGSVSATAILTECIWVCDHLSVSLCAFESVTHSHCVHLGLWPSFSLHAFGTGTVILTECIWVCDRHHSVCMRKLWLWLFVILTLCVWVRFVAICYSHFVCLGEICGHLLFSLCALGEICGHLLFSLCTFGWDLWPFVILTLCIWVRFVAICYSHFVHLGLWLFVSLFLCI